VKVLAICLQLRAAQVQHSCITCIKAADVDNVKTQVNMEENAALPNMFRTLPALKATERHLMDYLDSNDPLLGLGRVSMYLCDRQRSIRQDMAWQRMEVSLTQCSSVT